MKALVSSLLVAGMLAFSAPAAQAQRAVAASYSGYGHGYAASRVWVPGRYETVLERAWVPGCSERVWVDPVFELRTDCHGNRFRFLVRAGHYRTIHHPGHYETRSVRVWQPGHWAPRGHC